jgi:hypothetical protein
MGGRPFSFAVNLMDGCLLCSLGRNNIYLHFRPSS